ncbi:MAG TPA: hypothetical protein VF258_08755, partial [Luteolibacter sp.]
VDQIEALGVPSLIECKSLKVAGRLEFEAGVILRGDVRFENTGAERKIVDAGIYEDEIELL